MSVRDKVKPMTLCDIVMTAYNRSPDLDRAFQVAVKDYIHDTLKIMNARFSEIDVIRMAKCLLKINDRQLLPN